MAMAMAYSGLGAECPLNECLDAHRTGLGHPPDAGGGRFTARPSVAWLVEGFGSQCHGQCHGPWHGPAPLMAPLMASHTCGEVSVGPLTPPQDRTGQDRWAHARGACTGLRARTCRRPTLRSTASTAPWRPTWEPRACCSCVTGGRCGWWTRWRCAMRWRQRCAPFCKTHGSQRLVSAQGL